MGRGMASFLLLRPQTLQALSETATQFQPERETDSRSHLSAFLEILYQLVREPSVVGTEDSFFRVLRRELEEIGVNVEHHSGVLVARGSQPELLVLSAHIDRHGLSCTGPNEFQDAAFIAGNRGELDGDSISEQMMATIADRFTRPAGPSAPSFHRDLFGSRDDHLVSALSLPPQLDFRNRRLAPVSTRCTPISFLDRLQVTPTACLRPTRQRLVGGGAHLSLPVGLHRDGIVYGARGSGAQLAARAGLVSTRTDHDPAPPRARHQSVSHARSRRATGSRPPPQGRDRPVRSWVHIGNRARLRASLGSATPSKTPGSTSRTGNAANRSRSDAPNWAASSQPRGDRSTGPRSRFPRLVTTPRTSPPHSPRSGRPSGSSAPTCDARISPAKKTS